MCPHAQDDRIGLSNSDALEIVVTTIATGNVSDWWALGKSGSSIDPPELIRPLPMSWDAVEAQ